MKKYFISIKSLNYDIEIWINNIPLMKLNGFDNDHILDITKLIIPNENILEVVTAPGETPSTSRRSSPEPSSDQSNVIQAAIIDENNNFLLPLFESKILPPFPSILKNTFFIGKDSTRQWSWTKADPINKINTSPIREILTTLNKNRLNSNFESLFELKITSYKEYSYIEEEDFLVFRKKTIKKLKMILNYYQSNKLNPIILPEKEWDLRLVGKGNLIECIGKDWYPIVRTTTRKNGSFSGERIFIGKLNGEWKILLWLKTLYTIYYLKKLKKK